MSKTEDDRTKILTNGQQKYTTKLYKVEVLTFKHQQVDHSSKVNVNECQHDLM